MADIYTQPNYILTYPENYNEIIDLVIKCNGCLFGGSVRDFLRGDIRIDLDISVRNYSDFYENINILGYNELEDLDMFEKG